MKTSAMLPNSEATFTALCRREMTLELILVLRSTVAARRCHLIDMCDRRKSASIRLLMAPQRHWDVRQLPVF